MKKTLLALLLTSHLPLYANPDNIASLIEECDLRGATDYDPQRPENIPFRYYHRDGDNAYYTRAIHACTQAYEHSKDPRYLYQRGIIRVQHAAQDAWQRFLLGDAHEETAKTLLRSYGLEHSARNDLRQAAEQGHIAARFALARLDITRPETEQTMQALMDSSPRLAHLGLGVWHIQQAMMSSDAEQAKPHRAQAEKQLKSAIAEGENTAWLALATLYQLPGRGENEPSLKPYHDTLQEAIRHSNHPNLRSQLALVRYHLDPTPHNADNFRLDPIPGIDASDLDTERHYLRGMQYLKGLGIAENRAEAVKHLKLAAWGGHPEAQSILLSLHIPWIELPQPAHDLSPTQK